jgi:hypothetical protein
MIHGTAFERPDVGSDQPLSRSFYAIRVTIHWLMADAP